MDKKYRCSAVDNPLCRRTSGSAFNATSDKPFASWHSFAVYLTTLSAARDGKVRAVRYRGLTGDLEIISRSVPGETDK